MVEPAKQLVLVGLGGQARVVQDILHLCGVSLAGYIDRVQYDTNVPYLGQSVDDLDAATKEASRFHVAIGDNAIRQAKLKQLQAQKLALYTAIHPTAIMAASARIGTGSFVGARAVVNPHARLGECVLVNTGAIVEHDCVVGSCSHIAPGAVLCGQVQIGQGVLVGANATVLPGLRIGAGARLGAGATLRHDLAAGETYS